MVKNSQLIFKEVPNSTIIPGQHLKLEEVEIDIDSIKLDGGVLVKNLALSLDPAQRGRMRDPKTSESYAAAYEIGKPINGYVVGRVVKTENSRYPEGTILYGFSSFETYSRVTVEQLEGHLFYKIPDTHGLPYTNWVGALGMSGTTGHYGFYKLGAPKRGETIYVSAASGSVGAMVCQLAKKEGLKVIGSAGSEEKCEFLRSIGVDVVFNYKTQSTLDVLKANPFDIFLDSVGGETLDIVLATINRFGRIISVGAVSQYNLLPADKYRIANTFLITAKELDMRGFIISSAPRKDLTDFFATVPAMVASGELKVREHVTYGLDNGEALVDMLTGKAEGKAVISME